MNHETDELEDWLSDAQAKDRDMEPYSFNIIQEMQVIIDSLQRIETAITLIKDKHWYQVRKGNLNGS